MIRPEAEDLVLSDEQHQKILSDHTPVVQDIGVFGRGLIWNILTKCRASRSGNDRIQKNNAYGIQESPAQYSERLGRVAEEIGRLAKKHEGMSVIALQEVPIPLPTFHDEGLTDFHEQLKEHLRKVLGADWEVDKAPFLEMYKHKFGNLLVYKKSIFAAATNITMRRQIGSQMGRVLVVNLTPKDKHMPPLQFANVHFNWDKLVHYEVDYAVDFLIKEADGLPLIIAGDFNSKHSSLNRESLGDAELHPQDTSKLKADQSALRCDPEIDFFILSNVPKK